MSSVNLQLWIAVNWYPGFAVRVLIQGDRVYAEFPKASPHHYLIFIFLNLLFNWTAREHVHCINFFPLLSILTLLIFIWLSDLLTNWCKKMQHLLMMQQPMGMKPVGPPNGPHGGPPSYMGGYTGPVGGQMNQKMPYSPCPNNGPR